jgi:hypothetical protein
MGQDDLSGLARELAALHAIEQEMQDQSKMLGAGRIEDKLKEWLEKVRSIAEEFGPASFTISVGVPLGASVSSTWPTKA